MNFPNFFTAFLPNSPTLDLSESIASGMDAWKVDQCAAV